MVISGPHKKQEQGSVIDHNDSRHQADLEHGGGLSSPPHPKSTLTTQKGKDTHQISSPPLLDSSRNILLAKLFISLFLLPCPVFLTRYLCGLHVHGRVGSKECMNHWNRRDEQDEGRAVCSASTSKICRPTEGQHGVGLCPHNASSARWQREGGRENGGRNRGRAVSSKQKAMPLDNREVIIKKHYAKLAERR